MLERAKSQVGLKCSEFGSQLEPPTFTPHVNMLRHIDLGSILEAAQVYIGRAKLSLALQRPPDLVRFPLSIWAQKSPFPLSKAIQHIGNIGEMPASLGVEG